MTHVVAEPCSGCRYTDCVVVCRVEDRLESLLDEIASNSPAVHEAYRYATQCELDFFSAPLENLP